MAGLPGIFQDNPWLFATVALVWGLSLGSFTTCVLYRVPRGLSLVRDDAGSMHSFCPHCHAHLTALDLVPVFSWLFLRGHCRHCGVTIPARYLWIELSVVAAVGLLAAATGFSVAFFVLSSLIPVCVGMWAYLKRKKLVS